MAAFWHARRTVRCRRFAPVSGVSTKQNPSITRFSSGGCSGRSRIGKRWGGIPAAPAWFSGEADGLPGLIVDYYIADDKSERGQLVCQFMATGVEHWKEAIVQALIGATG